MIYPYYDGGRVAVFLAALFMGALTTALHRAVLERRMLACVVPASIGCTTVAMSFFGLSLVRDLRWLFLIVVSMVVVRRLLAPSETPAARRVEGWRAASLGRV
jgi:hypothetical protein